MKEYSIGTRVKIIRESKGFTQEDLAVKSNVTVGYIGRLERDQTNNVGFETYKAIANALEVPLQVILFGEIFAPNTIQGMEKPVEIKIPGQDLLPLSKEEEEVLLAFRSIKDRGRRMIVKEVVLSFENR